VDKKIKSNSTVEFEIYLRLSEKEARALSAITLYGADAFTKRFYEQLGKAYLKPHEGGIVSLFKTIQAELPGHLRKIDDARKSFLEGVSK